MNGGEKGGGNELNSSPSYPGEKISLNRNLTTVLGFASKAGSHGHMTPHHGDEGIKRHANPSGGMTACKTFATLLRSQLRKALYECEYEYVYVY